MVHRRNTEGWPGFCLIKPSQAAGSSGCKGSPWRYMQKRSSSSATLHRQLHFCDASSLQGQETNTTLNKRKALFQLYPAPFLAYKVKKMPFFLGTFWLTPAASSVWLQPAADIEIPGLIKTIFYVLVQALFPLPGEKWPSPQSAIEVWDCCAEQNGCHFLLIKAQLGAVQPGWPESSFQSSSPASYKQQRDTDTNGMQEKNYQLPFSSGDLQKEVV